MEKKLDGLAPTLICQLVVHTFPDFKTLVDKAITLKNECRSLEDFCKRKRDQTTHARNNQNKTDFQKNGANKSTTNVPRPTKNFMQGTRILHIAQVLLATLVERKGTMPNSAQSQETQLPSRTTVEIIQHPSITTSTPITITRRVT